MSKQPNPTVIGGFVIGAIVLLVGATVLFGGADFFVTKNRFSTYFEGSVKGLRAGANVTFRGVRIGYVKDIRVQVQIDSLQTLVPVTIEIVPSAFEFVEGERVVDEQELVGRLHMQQLIDAGLRAQLVVESYVTGQLLVEMNFLPEQAAVLRGINPAYPEIPTIPNDIDQVLGNIEKLIAGIRDKVDVDALVGDVQAIFKGFNELINSPDLSKLVDGLDGVINSPEMQNLGGAIGHSLKELDTTLAASRTFMERTYQQLTPLTGELGGSLSQFRTSLSIVTDDVAKALSEFEETLTSANKMMKTLDAKMHKNSAFSHQINETLSEFERAARALKVLADYLEQHPEALLRGKRGQ